MIESLEMGAAISAAFQTFIPKNSITFFGQNLIWSILVMEILAFVLSICSSADAFIAKTFLGQFSIGSVAAFLILGTMIDIKNILMLSNSFKKKYIFALIIYVFSICFVIGLFVNFMGMLGMI